MCLWEILPAAFLIQESTKLMSFHKDHACVLLVLRVSCNTAKNVTENKGDGLFTVLDWLSQTSLKTLQLDFY